MASVSGLSRDHRIRCRDRVVHAAKLALAHPTQVHYTQDGRRWDGIAKHRNSAHGQYPIYSDCSSFATWCLWNGLHLVYDIHDIVNGSNWKGGFTGTLRQHGRVVDDPSKALRGDLVHYGSGTGSHVTVVVGRENGHLMVISHGSEGGPYYTNYDYRPDVSHIRRYI
jgi:hypothetical protein